MQSTSPHPNNAELSKFGRFAFLPAEIRNLIWEFACTKPDRVHFLALPPAPKQLPFTASRDDIGDLDKYNPVHRHRMTVMLEYYRRQPKSNWTIPGRIHHKAALELPEAIRLACPESKAVFDKAASLLNNGLNLKDRWMAPVSPTNDVFCFRHDSKAWLDFDAREWKKTTNLFLTRPQVRPAQIAIEIMYDDNECIYTFGVDRSGTIRQFLPRWFSKSVEWARDAKEDSGTGFQVATKPPQASLAIDLQDLHTVFVLSYGITVDNPQICGNVGDPPVNFHNAVFEGFESRFYVIDPDSVESLQYWDIPPYAWAIRQEIEGLFNHSASWKVHVKFMAAIPKSLPKSQRSLLKALSPGLETWCYAKFWQEERKEACGSGSDQDDQGLS